MASPLTQGGKLIASSHLRLIVIEIIILAEQVGFDFFFIFLNIIDVNAFNDNCWAMAILQCALSLQAKGSLKIHFSEVAPLYLSFIALILWQNMELILI